MLARLTQYHQAFSAWLWQPEIEQLPSAKAQLIRALRIINQVVNELRSGLLNLRAMSLVYTTLLSLVPLLAVSFSVLKGFGVHNQLEPLLLNLLAPLGTQGEEISGRIIEFVDNTRAMALGSLGLGVLIFTVISLMKKIEQAFNHTWHISKQRSFIQRFSHYLSIIVIGPVLIFSALGLMASMLSTTLMQQLINEPSIGWLVQSLKLLLPYLLISAAFTLIYLFIPNTRVRFRSALLGGLIAAMLWQSCGWLFASFVANSASHAAVYSAFAALILFIIWLYLGWLILLVGSSIAFHYQHPVGQAEQLDIATISIQDREQLGLLIVQRISQRHYQQHSPYTIESLSHELGLPMPLVTALIAALEQAKIIVECTNEEGGNLLPAQPFDQLTLGEVWQALRHHGQQIPLLNRPLSDSQLEQLSAGPLFNITLKQLAEQSSEK
ncbi:Inner membrane protein YihY, formerly thought to be RNase BN [hydrothermal vent metagenome]|uniref:Inner membrane protein YihY, formerly thought to be RNase BN n=1 Tax=hydrothermal vent metagenome TaxID=652676 RepID=A0A3B1ACE9_9ZZZZ